MYALHDVSCYHFRNDTEVERFVALHKARRDCAILHMTAHKKSPFLLHQLPHVSVRNVELLLDCRPHSITAAPLPALNHRVSLARYAYRVGEFLLAQILADAEQFEAHSFLHFAHIPFLAYAIMTQAV